MANQKQKLELTWIGKEERPKLEPRILVEDPAKSYGDAKAENILIHGDNLLALKALEQDFAGKIKCIYIDPPYNTGSAFEHYDDGLEHSLWLTLIRVRADILRSLLREDGMLWINIDDNEAHYLKVLLDEVFGRSHFVANVLWQKRTSPDMRASLGAGHDHILVYAKDPAMLKLNKLEKTLKQIAAYKNPDNDPRGPWVSSDYTAQGFRPNQMYKIKTPGGKIFSPPKGVCWKNVEEVFLKLVSDNRIWFGKDGMNMPRRKTFLSESEGNQSWTWWTNEEVGHNQEAKKENIVLFGAEEVFDTPKPERLLRRIIEIATDPGDWVLDSFAGSGTTGAVAHKMGRKWIMVELGEHATTHCLPRMKKVVDGKDGLPLSEKLGWEGGGGFKFYNLAPSLLRKDKFNNWVIDENYNANMLAAAMCKHEGFKFNPDPEIYWKQGKSTETDYIFVTTAFFTVKQLDKIHDEMKDNESLLICAKAYSAECESRHANITVRKIPQMILKKCDFGKDNYNLHIVNLPVSDGDSEEVQTDTLAPGSEQKPKAGKRLAAKATKNAQKGLF